MMKARNVKSTLNPFQAIPDEVTALDCAKAGVWVPVITGLGYALAMTFGIWNRETMYGTDVGSEIALFIVISLVFIGVAIFLAYAIWRWQAFWALILAALWSFIEFFSKYLTAIDTVSFLTVMLTAASVLATILSLRGMLKLRRLRSDARADRQPMKL